MISKSVPVIFFLLVLHGASCKPSWAGFVIQSQIAVDIELVGYNGLADNSLFKGSIPVGGSREIDTLYRGLALLVYDGGQRYPVIVGDESFTLKINNTGELPSFAGSSENDFFYRLLSGGDSGSEKYNFALLMIQAKELLGSSHSVHTIGELRLKKKEFHRFISVHYKDLKHSDMIIRLIAQYFMMHEYVNYHIEGAPATDIRDNYQKAVLKGVGDWIDILKSHIPEYEILNYCVSLYYNRSMITLASLIIENYRDAAYCPGSENKTFNFPGDLNITEANRNRERQLYEFKGNKIIAFVSDDCPVSMVETISKVRQLIDRKEDNLIIIAPLEKLSGKYLAMRRMVSGGDMFFINDEKWRKENLAQQVRLPLFHRIGYIIRQ